MAPFDVKICSQHLGFGLFLSIRNHQPFSQNQSLALTRGKFQWKHPSLIDLPSLKTALAD